MSPKKSTSLSYQIALCYIRKSWTRDEKDLISPERQREHIQRICDVNGWTPEWYEDTDGHKSGMHEKNRPGWLALKERLRGGGVVALVANDLARLHRRGWRIGDLIDFVDQHGVRLVLADPARSIDFSTPHGRMVAQLTAIFDEWYALDISQRWKSSIRHRKSKNITVGRPPFGTKRDPVTHYLIPSNEGVWWMPSGRWEPGIVGDEPPAFGAIWRGYYDCARTIIELYVQDMGRGAIVDALYQSGYAFRDLSRAPRRITVDDVRRVLTNWPEYGGVVLDKRAKDRKHYELITGEVVLDPSRAVFPVEMLQTVGVILCERSVKRTGVGQSKEDFPYPLSLMVYCACCDKVAREENTPNRRSRLIGHKTTAYKHRPGLKCGTHRTIIARSIIERKVIDLCKLMTVSAEDLDLMVNLVDSLYGQGDQREQLEKRKAEEIARARHRIEAAKYLFMDGDLTGDEYASIKRNSEAEIAQWASYGTESQMAALQIATTAEAISRLVTLWDGSDNETRRGMIRNLFEYIVWDFDLKEIADFKLKPWAEQFVTVRAATLETEGFLMRPRQGSNL